MLHNSCMSNIYSSRLISHIRVLTTHSYYSDRDCRLYFLFNSSMERTKFTYAPVVNFLRPEIPNTRIKKLIRIEINVSLSLSRALPPSRRIFALLPYNLLEKL